MGKRSKNIINYQLQIKVIGFDLDQTLYPKSPEIDDAIQAYLYKEIADYKKVSLEEAEKMFKDLYLEGKGLSGSKSMEALGIPNGKEAVQIALEKADIASFLKPDEEVLKLLKDLKIKYKNLDLITGSSKSIVDDKLREIGIKKSIFNNIITADEASKPDLSAFKMWFNFYPNLKPEQFLYIGDRPFSDFIAPSSLGISVILVNQKEKDSALNCPQLESFVDLKKKLL
ncbi:MAG: HAD family hydrolase [Candidatus Paceibacterota bacterium]|jgi:FMN phosphatase YigB (HAD superfamily)